MKRFLFSLLVCLSSVTSLGILLLALSMVSFAQNNLPLHINSAPDTPTSAQQNWSDYDSYALTSPYMTGATVNLVWNAIDTGTKSSGCPNISSTNWSNFDTALSNYTSGGKMVNLIVMPVTEGGSNNSTPAYVFSQTWANNLANNGCAGLGSGVVLTWQKNEPVLPGNYIFVTGSGYWQETAQPWSSTNEFVGTCTTSKTSEPGFIPSKSPYTDNTCVWTYVSSSNAPPQDACFTPSNNGPGSGYPGDGVILNANGGTAGCFNVNNLPGGSAFTDLETGFPVSYETPMATAYMNFVQQVISHYQMNPNNVTNLGYIRFGLSEGGESSPITANIPWPYFRNLPNNGPLSGASIVFLSYINSMLQFQKKNNGGSAALTLLADMNAFDGIPDYADQEALYANQNNLGIGTNGLQVSDVTNIETYGCSNPSTTTNLISGDWCYNFQKYCGTTMGNGKYPICSLQPLQLSTPGNNTSDPQVVVGSLSDEYWSNGTTWANFPGLIPTAAAYGANNLEIRTCDILYTVLPASNTYPDTSNCTSTNHPAPSPYQNDYQNAFALFLNPNQPGIYSPAPGAQIQSDSSATLTWYADSGTAAYALEIGSTQGGSDYHAPINVGNVLTKTLLLSPSPTTGDPVWVRWRAVNSSGGVILQTDFHFVAP
jgi:hypothetical protein